MGSKVAAIESAGLQDAQAFSRTALGAAFNLALDGAAPSTTPTPVNDNLSQEDLEKYWAAFYDRVVGSGSRMDEKNLAAYLSTLKKGNVLEYGDFQGFYDFFKGTAFGTPVDVELETEKEDDDGYVIGTVKEEVPTWAFYNKSTGEYEPFVVKKGSSVEVLNIDLSTEGKPPAYYAIGMSLFSKLAAERMGNPNKEQFLAYVKSNQKIFPKAETAKK